jgi:hypothetical protein
MLSLVAYPALLEQRRFVLPVQLGPVERHVRLHASLPDLLASLTQSELELQRAHG